MPSATDAGLSTASSICECRRDALSAVGFPTNELVPVEIAEASPRPLRPQRLLAAARSRRRSVTVALLDQEPDCWSGDAHPRRTARHCDAQAVVGQARRQCEHPLSERHERQHVLGAIEGGPAQAPRVKVAWTRQPIRIPL
jgi:hypothetical protein